MLLKHIRFKNRQALKVEITSSGQIAQALKTLGLDSDRPVIVIIGGAGGINEQDWPAIQACMKTIATAAQNMQAAIIDGGTASGVMRAIGQARAEYSFTFPLIGVAAEGTVNWPGRRQSIIQKLIGNFKKTPLDANHTHFILVPGYNWGDESSWISDIATQLAGKRPSVAVLVNGGTISRDQDIPNNLAARRPLLVIKGTGRAADAIASQPKENELINFVEINEPQSLEIKLKKYLKFAP